MATGRMREAMRAVIRAATGTTNDADVLVLGGGIAGLVAARELSRDRRVIVLEAQQRVGGRIDSVEDPGLALPIERGPEFVHGHVAETFDLLREAGLIAHDIPDKHQDGNRGKIVDTDKQWAAADELLSKLKKIDGADCSFAEFLKTHAKGASPAVRRRAISFVEGFNAARKDDISAKALRIALEAEEKDDGEKQYRLMGAYAQLPEAVAASIESPSRIVLGARVRRVTWAKDAVTVETGEAERTVTYRAPKVVVALPLGVLQRAADAPGGIVFEPELPTRADLRSRLAMGPVVKVVVRFKEPFWEAGDNQDLSFVHNDQAAFPTWWTALPLRTTRLTGWAGGAAADALPNDEAKIRKLAMQSLSTIFGKSAAWLQRRVDLFELCDWRHDPNTFGGYAYARVGGADDPTLFQRPINRTLFFAGEHTELEAIGTVSGAIASGKRAAARLLRAR